MSTVGVDDNDEDGGSQAPVVGRGEWTAEEMKKLSQVRHRHHKSRQWLTTPCSGQALKKYPGGVKRRWFLLATAVGTRSEEDVVKKVKQLKSYTKRAGAGKRGIRRPSPSPSPSPSPAAAAPTAANNEAATSTPAAAAPTAKKASNSVWDSETQLKLEAALRAVNAMPDAAELSKAQKWRRIATRVPGKSAKQCALRFRAIKQAMLAKSNE